MKLPKFSPAMAEVLTEVGYHQLTPIQQESIPWLLEGRDLIGQSQTGSGKTAAFSIPILERLDPELCLRDRTTRALILCPTRELSAQVAREIRRLARRHSGLQVVVLGGGVPIYTQIQALERGAHIAVGTPGRLLDHLRRGTLDLKQVGTLVLDEADRMLDMGFAEDMELILSELPQNRQTVLFSATFPRSIEDLIRRYLKQPERVVIEQAPEEQPTIDEELIEVTEDQKTDALLHLLAEHRPASSIIFCNLKTTVAELAQALKQNGVAAAALHGDLEQADRDRVMAKFRNQSLRVLVATDVAARGIDVEKLDWSVNFDLPSDPEVYVHRIGRTGRAGQTGRAISLVSSRDFRKIAAIEEFMGTQLSRGTSSPTFTNRDQEGVNLEAPMKTLFIGAGRKDKLRPGDLLGALTGEAGGLQGAQVGKIEIHDRFAYVAVATDVAKLAVQRLSLGRIKGRKIRVGFAR